MTIFFPMKSMRSSHTIVAKKVRRLLVAAIVSAPFLSMPMALADDGRLMLEKLFTTHKTMTDFGMPGIIKNAGMRLPFFEYQSMLALDKLKKRVHPLTGGKTAKIEAYEISDTSREGPNDSRRYLVVVTNEGKPNLLHIDVLKTGVGMQIVNITGEDERGKWSLLEAKEATTLNAPSTPAPSSQARSAPSSPRQRQEQGQEQGADNPSPASSVSSDAQAPTSTTSEPNAQANLLNAFVADFSGSDIGDGWRVEHEDRNLYLVENGELMVINRSRRPESLEHGKQTNLFIRNGNAPTEDFRIETKARIDIKTGYEKISIGLRPSQDRYLATSLMLRKDGCGFNLFLTVENRRPLRGSEERSFTTLVEYPLFGNNWIERHCGAEGRQQADAILARIKNDGAVLSLVKKDLFYHAELSVVGEPALTFTSGDFSHFETLSNAFLHISEGSHDQDEAVIMVDHFSFKMN